MKHYTEKSTCTVFCLNCGVPVNHDMDAEEVRKMNSSGKNVHCDDCSPWVANVDFAKDSIDQARDRIRQSIVRLDELRTAQHLKLAHLIQTN